MSRKCGQMRQASSDTTVRPTRQVSDTRNCFLATTVAAPSYKYRTLLRLLPPKRRLPSPVRTSHTHCRPSATKTPIHGRLSPSWSVAGRREFRVFSDTETCFSATTTLAAQLRTATTCRMTQAPALRLLLPLPLLESNRLVAGPTCCRLGGCHGLP